MNAFYCGMVCDVQQSAEFNVSAKWQMSSKPSYFSRQAAERKVLFMYPLIHPVISSLSASQLRQGPVAEAFVSLLPAEIWWEAYMNNVSQYNKYVFAKNKRNSNSPVEIHQWCDDHTRDIPIPHLGLCQQCCCFTLWVQPSFDGRFCFPARLFSQGCICIIFYLHILSDAQARLCWIEMVLSYSRGSLRTQWWTVFICCCTSWLAGNDVNYIRCFIRRDRLCHILCKFMTRMCEFMAVKLPRKLIWFHLSLEANRKRYSEKK